VSTEEGEVRKTANRWTDGFSLLELVIVSAISVVALAVAAPVLLSTYRAADLKTAQADMAAALRRASEEAATGGRRVALSVESVPLPARVVVNPQGVAYVGATRVACELEFGGAPATRGYRTPTRPPPSFSPMPRT
jgi:prepilin-type N-terminal cleavage/methylation domain-containing protein